MGPEPVLISYSLRENDENFKTTYFTASGIKFEGRWVLTHGSLVLPLKAASSILKNGSKLEATFPENKFYKRLPNMYVTYEKRLTTLPSLKPNESLSCSSRDGSDVSSQYNYLENICVSSGRIKFIWRNRTLRDLFLNLFATWTIGNKPGNSDKQDDEAKKFLSVFVLIDIQDSKSSPSPSEVLTNIYYSLSQKNPQRSDELTVFGTPFGNEIFLNSLTKGAVCNTVGSNSNVVLCDASTSIGFEGGPVHFRKSGTLVGMTISSLSWWRGEWVGITLIAFLTPIIHDLLHPLKIFKPPTLIHNVKDLPFIPLLDEIDQVIGLIRCGYDWGSGVLINKGYVLTCSHCVKEHDTHPVSFYVAGKSMKAKVVFRTRNDVAFDLALLKIDEMSSNHFLKMAKSRAFKGETVVAVGFPYFSEKQIKDLRPTITKGTVNNVSPHMIQTSCCIQSGYSGGAILRICMENETLQCYLLGIIVCNAKDDTNNTMFPNLNMAVPVNAFQNILDKFLCNPTSSDILRDLENQSHNVQSLWKLQFYNSNL